MSSLPPGLAAIYAELPTVACKGRCSESCGPIPLTRVEKRALAAELGSTRKLTTIPALAHQRYLEVLVNEATGRCPLILFERCTAYPARPLVCRLFGMTPEMACPWGCQPSRWVEKEEAMELLRRIHVLEGTLKARR